MGKAQKESPSEARNQAKLLKKLKKMFKQGGGRQ
jgi:hypothetical protein